MARTTTTHKTRTLTKAAAAAATPEAIIDLVQRLGLVDLAVDRVRARLAEADVDEIFDEIGDYVRRNPEAIVVALGAITIASGVLVYLSRNQERDFTRRGEDIEIEVPRHRERETPARSRAASPSASTSASRRRTSPTE